MRALECAAEQLSKAGKVSLRKWNLSEVPSRFASSRGENANSSHHNH